MKQSRLASAALIAAGLSAFGLTQASAAETGYQGVSYSWSGTTVTVHVTKALSHELVVDGASWTLDNAPSTWPQSLASVQSLVVPAGQTGDFTVTVPSDGGCGQSDLYAGSYQFPIPAHLAGPGSANGEPTLAQLLFPGNSNSYRFDTSACAVPTPTVTPTATTTATPTSTPSPSRSVTPSPSSTTTATSTATPTVSSSPSATSTPSSTTSSPTAPPTATPSPSPSRTAHLIPPTRYTRTPSPDTPSPTATAAVTTAPRTSQSAQVHGIPSGPADTGSGSSSNRGLVDLGVTALLAGLAVAVAAIRVGGAK